MSDSSDATSGCGPFTDPASKACTLPSGAKDLPGTFPKMAAQDKAIEARYGKATDPMSQMKFIGKPVKGFRVDDGYDS